MTTMACKLPWVCSCFRSLIECSVVLHGTDTMAYSAAALSYMLQNLGKPVVFTGSQIPFCDPHVTLICCIGVLLIVAPQNDARRNVLASILVAGNFDIPEVCLYFNDKLLRGNRATKRYVKHSTPTRLRFKWVVPSSTSQLDAFESPNFPILGESQIEFKIHQHRVLEQPKGRLVCHKQLMTGLSVMRLVPGGWLWSRRLVQMNGCAGFDDDDMVTMMEARRKLDKPGAMVLMLYGTGAPENSQPLSGVRMQGARQSANSACTMPSASQ